MCCLIACNSLFEILFAFGVPDAISADRNFFRCDVVINAMRDQNADHSGADIANDTDRAITESMGHLFVDCSMDVNFNAIPNQEVRNSMEGGGRPRFCLCMRINPAFPNADSQCVPSEKIGGNRCNRS
jgi:hypothetical protein